MLTYLTFALFPFVLFFLSAALVTGLPVAVSLQNYYRSRERDSVICPDNDEPADVQRDAKFAFWSALRGQEHSRLEACSRWPEKGDCGQECLEQVEPSPENIERLLTKWYDGKSCAVCTCALWPADWERSRMAGLNSEQKLVELRDMQLDEIQAHLADLRPLCWNCHQEERRRQPVPTHAFKGDRQSLAPAPID